MAHNKEDRAFKILINKRVTSATKKFYEEIGANTLDISFSEVRTQAIAYDTPAVAVTAGVAQAYTLFTLTQDTQIPNFQCYYAFANGNRLGDWISDKYGSAYTIGLYDNNDVRIAPTDAVADWFFDYTTGILNFNGNMSSYAKPFKITAYRYVGKKGAEGLSTEKVVANIAERDALTGLFVGQGVLVSDATADPTVKVGYGYYKWSGSTFLKVAEGESLDVDISMDDTPYSYSTWLTERIKGASKRVLAEKFKTHDDTLFTHGTNIATLRDDLDTNSGAITVNTGAIATNTTNIATNTTNIATNTTNIATNTTNIAANTSAIAALPTYEPVEIGVSKQGFTATANQSVFTVTNSIIKKLLYVTVNGLIQEETLDFTLSGNAITLLPGARIDGGEIITVHYFDNLTTTNITTVVETPEHIVKTVYNVGVANPSFGALFSIAINPGFSSSATNMQVAPGTAGYYEFKIAGTGFALWHLLYENQQIKYDVWVNGAVVGTVDYTSPSTIPCKEVYRLSGLTFGIHTVRIIAVAAYNSIMILDQIRVSGTFTTPY